MKRRRGGGDIDAIAVAAADSSVPRSSSVYYGQLSTTVERSSVVKGSFGNSCGDG